MANLRRSLRPQQVVPLTPVRRRAPLRWPWLAGAAVTALLALAWIDGGEQPLRPIAEPARLPELPQ